MNYGTKPITQTNNFIILDRYTKSGQCRKCTGVKMHRSGSSSPICANRKALLHPKRIGKITAFVEKFKGLGGEV